jgi:hypothetical protein
MKKFALIGIIAIGIAASYSCYGDPAPGTAKIIVVDTADYKVPNAMVKLSQPGQLNTGFIIHEGITDLHGHLEAR